MKGIKKAATAVMVLWMLTTGSTALGDVEVVNLGIQGDHYDLVSDSAGTLHIIWKDGPMHYGLLEGTSVTEIDAIPDSNLMRRERSKPRLAVQHGGETVHTAWFNGDGISVTHAWCDGSACHNEGQVWTKEAEYNMYDPMIAVAPDAALHMIMQKWPYNYIENRSEIAYYYRPPSGSWQDFDIISDNDQQYRDTFIVCDDSGGVHAGWLNSYRHAPSGGAWEALEALPRLPGDNMDCCGDMAIGDDGTVHYALKAYPSLSIVYMFKPPGGGWQGPEPLEALCRPEQYEVWPAIAVGDNGKIYIVWANDDCSDTTVRFVRMAVRDTDGTCTFEDLDTDSDIGSGGARMAKSDGVIHVIWSVAGNDIVLYTIDTTVTEPEPDQDEVEAGPEEGTPEIPPDATDWTVDTFQDTMFPDPIDAADTEHEGTGGASGGCGCRIM